MTKKTKATTASLDPKQHTIFSLHAGYETKKLYTDAFIARPTIGQELPGMILLSGMGGLTWKQREITRRYARAGFVALSPDFMGGTLPANRTAGLYAKNSLDFNESVERIIGAAAFLRTLPWVGAKARIGIMGFCLGGGLALLGAARSRAFSACIVYHQSLFPDERELAHIDCPIQGHFGTDDHSTPAIEVNAFNASLNRLNKAYECHWYSDMGHSFAQVTPDAEIPVEQKNASDLSYQRSFEFLKTNLCLD